MIRGALLILLLCCGSCATVERTRVIVPYTRSEPVGDVAAEAVNALGHELPMPPAGLIEQAVRAVTRQPESESSITDAFARAASERLRELHVRVVPVPSAASLRLRISVLGWDVHDSGATGSVVVVFAHYELLDGRGNVLWRADQASLPVRMNTPNLSRTEVDRIAHQCVELALASLPVGSQLNREE